MRRLLPLLAAALLLAGCASKGTTDATTTAPAATTTTASTATTTAATTAPGGGNVSAIPPAPSASLPSNVTAFHWASNRTGDLAVRFTLAVPERDTCQAEVSATGTRPDAGPGAVWFLREPGNADPRYDGGALVSTVHAGPLDSGAVQGSPDYSEGGSASLPGIGGTLEFVLLARGSATLALDWTCDQPFSVGNATVGRAVHLFNLLNMEGDAAQGALAGSATAGSTASATLAEGPVEALLFLGGVQHVDWTLTTPAGSDTGSGNVGDQLVSMTGPAGAYKATVQRAAAYDDRFWVAFVGSMEPFVP